MKGTWELDTVREKRDVIAESRRNGKTAHFGTLMDLCHLKHAELAKGTQKYKGRVVFRGDFAKDEEGFYAVLLNKEHLPAI